MSNRLSSAALLVALCTFNPLASAFFAPPTDAEIAAIVDGVKTAGANEKDQAKLRAAKMAAADEAFAKLNISELTVANIDALGKVGILASTEARTALAPRLAELAKDNTVDGAKAAMLRHSLAPMETPKSREEYEAGIAKNAPLLIEAMKHPKAGELAALPAGDMYIRGASQLPAASLKGLMFFETFTPLLTANLSPEATGALQGIINMVADDDTKLSKEERATILGKIATTAEAVSKKMSDTPGFDEAKLRRVTSVAKSARSPWAMGELVGAKAPEIVFNWSNQPEQLSSLSSLKGKVVLIDFWATWCGPCVASFPKIRELQTRYQDFPVAIVGVTSLQGFHMDQKARNRIDTKGDPKKEMELMTTFMKDMDMTWTVAFSEDSCFNPMFGVSGIPHLAILAPDGTVRFNELRPGDPAEEAEKIDALLKEFKLAAPDKPMEPAKPKAPKGE